VKNKVHYFIIVTRTTCEGRYERSYFLSIVRAQASTAISCVELKKAHIKNIIMRIGVLGLRDPSSLPSQSSTFIAKSNNIRPVRISTIKAKIELIFKEFTKITTAMLTERSLGSRFSLRKEQRISEERKKEEERQRQRQRETERDRERGR